MKRNLSKLNKVELREVWGHEAIDFTNWLALQENLDALSEEIGVDIKLIKTEADVGRFSVDILAEEGSGGRKNTKRSSSAARAFFSKTEKARLLRICL